MPKPHANPLVAERQARTGGILAAARRAKGLTQQQTADATGVSIHHWKAIEGGQRAPGPTLWPRIASVLSVTPPPPACPHCGRDY
jgi:transcriptional regulator with XRE-family HTH domain